MVELHFGDCIEIMRTLPDKSIDLILTDPPYGTTACKWDSIIPFEPMWGELKRLRKDRGAILLFGAEPFSSNLRLSNITEFKYDWYWNKKFGVNFLHAKREPLKVVETISVFGLNPAFVPIMEHREKPIKKGKNIAGKSSGYFLDANRYTNKIYDKKHPVTLLDFSSRTGKRGLHPTQKPVPLLEYLIRTYTVEYETVLDFTMGSGSTGVACKKLNRKFIGIEKDSDFFHLAKLRIEQFNLE